MVMKYIQVYSILALVCFSMFIFVYCSAPEGYQPTAADDASTLDLVHVLFRHGDRTPVFTYPTDPYNDEHYWPDGFGLLTSRGKMRSYRLGQFLRRRYSDFLSGPYSSKEVVVRSTDRDRTLSSALCMLAGLFPPRGTQMWNPQLDWQPIPVHTVNYTEDALLNVYSYCPRKKEEQKRILQTPEYNSVWEKHTDLKRYLEQKTGQNVTSFSEIQDIYDALEIEDSYGFKLPSWTKSVYPDVLKPLADYWVTVPSLGDEWTKLRAGPLLKEISEHMEGRRNGSLECRRKIYFYAAHDFSIASQMQAMGVWEGKTPPFSSTLLYELHRKNGQYFVKIVYRDDPSQAPRNLALRGCSSFCPLDKFLELVKPVIPKDYNSECRSKS